MIATLRRTLIATPAPPGQPRRAADHAHWPPARTRCPPSSPRSAPCQPPANPSQPSTPRRAHQAVTGTQTPGHGLQAPHQQKGPYSGTRREVPGHRHVLQPGLTTPRSSTGLWITSAALLVDSGLILLGLAAAAATVAVPTSASASTVTSPVVGYTYVDGNTAPANTIDGFARHADGSLTPLAGSPFSAGGAGLGSGLASQGAIQVTADGRYLLAVDAGSNQISVLRLTANGVPVLGPAGILGRDHAGERRGLPVRPGLRGEPGQWRQRLLLLPPERDGRLTPIAGSTVTVPDGSGLGDVFFNAFGNHLIGTRTGTSLIDSFVVLPGGHLLAAHGSPFTGQGLGQLGAEFSPTNPSQLFVSNAHNGTGLGTVSAYHEPAVALAWETAHPRKRRDKPAWRRRWKSSTPKG